MMAIVHLMAAILSPFSGVMQTTEYHRAMHELAPGVWHWQAPHPEWRPGEPWDRNVSSYAIDDGGGLVLFDPIAPPVAIEARTTAIVLTAPWHERDAQGLVERLGVPVYTPLPDTAEDLMRMWGLTAEQAGDGSPDLAWLLKDGIGEAHEYAAGDRLDVGVEAFPGEKPNDLVLWVESHGAVVAGDTLVGFGRGLQINPRWLGPEMAWEDVAAGLRPPLDLPVEHVLAAHGGPFDRAALERALSSPG
jgi:glyoxylase-like metal-dependent hydrolase (beta-lactamase superfamily II)